MRPPRRHITFVSGTRADLNLLLPTLAAIRAHPKLRLSVVATGMHFSRLPAHGGRLAAFTAAGFAPDATVAWPEHRDVSHLSEITLTAGARLAAMYRKLGTEGVVVLGDRVEAFAAAAAAHLSHLPLAHIHGGDRAEGQLDDALRHAISQLAHLHLAASADSAERLLRLGQDPRTVHIVGAPGVERITRLAAPRAEVLGRFPHIGETAVVLLHPGSTDPKLERRRAEMLLRALRLAGIANALLLPPNTDPGNQGIHAAWREAAEKHAHFTSDIRTDLLKDLPRPFFLGLLAHCRLLAGNSSAGIIEASSFGTPVLDVGSRQGGRVAPGNVAHAEFSLGSLAAGLRAIPGRSGRRRSDNPYARANTARRIAGLLAGSWLSYPASPKRLAH